MKTAVEAMLCLRSAQIFDELVGAHEVHAVTLLDRAQPERDGEMRLADTGRNSHMLRSFRAPSPSTTAGTRWSVKR